jgi:hypothetical protein
VCAGTLGSDTEARGATRRTVMVTLSPTGRATKFFLYSCPGAGTDVYVCLFQDRKIVEACIAPGSHIQPASAEGRNEWNAEGIAGERRV